MSVEFERPQRVDTIGDDARTVEIDADAQERAALAKRFDLIGIEKLTGKFTIRRDAAGIVADGRVQAAVTQACSITGDPLPATVDEQVALRFVAEADAGQDEVELGDSDIDVIPYEGGTIDLGEVAAETMALALDPFPRGPNAEAVLKEAGVLSEEQASPFGVLAGLKDKLAKK
ncbi:YceD family protein [Sphingomonas asaccharolytica]|uniref:YceD family protein n=1 Tax=Sphingomonas asaccharolytica TaxID=40681 RepID=UPI0008339679|nr:DUF177 domain-containing protein [Sphingomonas asaccharolytica]